MERGAGLEEVLAAQARDPASGLPAEAAARAILLMSSAALELAAIVARPPLGSRLGAATGGANVDGDQQRTLDIVAEDLFRGALRTAGVAGYLSEEVEAPTILDPAGSLAVAIDPLDGSSNIDVNAPIGTIFSILPAAPGAANDPALAFRETGRAQVAAGFFIYGPQTMLVMTLGLGAQAFALDRTSGEFVLIDPAIAIPRTTAEYAINASNARHWHAPVQRYIDDCTQGAAGPRGKNFNMRWVASLVADAYRAFVRGGVYLYPSDARKGYGEGRLRLMYEVNPVAFLAEQAGGAATDGLNPILDRTPGAPHQRAPLVMGSIEEVERIAAYHRDG